MPTAGPPPVRGPGAGTGGTGGTCRGTNYRLLLTAASSRSTGRRARARASRDRASPAAESRRASSSARAAIRRASESSEACRRECGCRRCDAIRSATARPARSTRSGRAARPCFRHATRNPNRRNLSRERPRRRPVAGAMPPGRRRPEARERTESGTIRRHARPSRAPPARPVEPAVWPHVHTRMGRTQFPCSGTGTMSRLLLPASALAASAAGGPANGGGAFTSRRT